MADASTYIEKLDDGEISFTTAFDALKRKYPKVSNDKLNETLGGSIPYSNGTWDTESATGRAVSGYQDQKAREKKKRETF